MRLSVLGQGFTFTFTIQTYCSEDKMAVRLLSRAVFFLLHRGFITKCQVKAEQFRNSILAERMNGEGHYLENPNYDWAYAIIHNYVYEVFKRIRLDALEQSSYSPLADVAAKIKREQFYHLYHWEVWIDQLAHSTEEAHKRLNDAVVKTWKDVASLLDQGPLEQELVQYGLIESGKAIREKFLNKIRSKLESAGLTWPGEPKPAEMTGREGRHTEELAAALEELSEVYKLAPQASW